MTAVTTVDRGPRVVARGVIANAPAADLFALLTDPRKHGLVDGSGTVKDNVKGPSALSEGARFTTAMRMFGVPYRITSTVTEYVDTPDQKIIEWAHPAGHRWRWEFAPTADGRTEVTESFDPRPSKIGKVFEKIGVAEQSAAGSTASLSRLAEKFDSPA